MLVRQLVLVSLFVFTGSYAFADCNSRCDDPVCILKRSLCEGTFAACVKSALATDRPSTGCVAAVIADFESEGSISDATVAVCGVAADALQQVANNCD